MIFLNLKTGCFFSGCQKQKIIQFREKLLKKKAEDAEEDEDAGTMEDNDDAEKKDDTDVHLDLNIDLKPQINSFEASSIGSSSIQHHIFFKMVLLY